MQDDGSFAERCHQSLDTLNAEESHVSAKQQAAEAQRTIMREGFASGTGGCSSSCELLALRPNKRRKRTSMTAVRRAGRVGRRRSVIRDLQMSCPAESAARAADTVG
jgi:hypothetical protein